jgi:hypothetical protein
VRTRLGAGRVIAYFQMASEGGAFRVRMPTQSEIRMWAQNPAFSSRVLNMYEVAYGQKVPVSNMRGRTDWLVDRLETAFRKRLLFLIEDDLPSAPVAQKADEDADSPDDDDGSPRKPPARAEKEEKTWFRARLLDEDGEPMANEDYILVDTQGARRKGKLDANGEVYVPPILPPGDCTISFPNIHLNPRKRK